MSRVISYSLFGDPSNFEFNFYLRGCYWNARMNRLLYPEWTTMLMVTEWVLDKYAAFLYDVSELSDSVIVKIDVDQPRCEAMLNRMIPMFFSAPPTHVVCRDLDSVSTYREANCLYHWMASGLPYHAINDNDANGGLMGGLVSFRTKDFLKDTKYTSFSQMIKGLELSKHGSDQNFLNKFVHPKIKHGLLMHKLKGAGIQAARVETSAPNVVDKKYWVSDLISRYIGSAGVIDMELLRFFQSFDKNPKFDDFERKHSDVCYWRR
jgi:hypothetical protein